MRIAGVQMDVVLGQPGENLAHMIRSLETAADEGAELVIFPECALTGYVFAKRTEAARFAQTIPGPATEAIVAACRQHRCLAVFGLIEQAGESLFNSVALVGPDGVIGSYRKVHLPFMGADRFLDYGDRPFAVQEVTGARSGESLRVGLNICYDAGFPEAARCLTLLGADLIVLPTNWPVGAQCTAEYAINTRAMENTVYYAAINRVGTEAGTRFIGSSRICDPLGRTVATGPLDEATILYADVDPALSRSKHLIRVPNEAQLNRLADRRPDFYSAILEPHSLPMPREVPRPQPAPVS